MSRWAAWRAVLTEAAAALDFVPASWAAHLVTQTAPNSQRVAIANQTFVRKFFHGASPVGHYVDKDTMIVGVVEDVAIEPGLGPAAPLSDEESRYIPATEVDARSLALRSAMAARALLKGAVGIFALVANADRHDLAINYLNVLGEGMRPGPCLR